MKFDKKLLQRSTDQFVVYARELSSRGSSFVILMLGMLLQASHTTLLMYNVSAFDSTIIRGLVAFGIGIFVSGALAIFTLKADGKNKDINSIINVFFYFEIFTNIFYYWNSLIFSSGIENATMQNWLYLIVAMPFSYIMPYTIKKFAGVIRTEETLDFGAIDIIGIEDTKKDDEMTEQEIIALFEKLMLEHKQNTPESEVNQSITELGGRVDEMHTALENLVDKVNKSEVKVGTELKISANGKVGSLEVVGVNNSGVKSQDNLENEEVVEMTTETPNQSE